MLWVVLVIVLLLVIVVAKPLLRKQGRAVDFSLYRKKDRVMNESEQALYINLQKVLGDRFIILSKVRIEDFVEAERGENHYGARGRIKSRHVDFLVCDFVTTKPLLAVELDGKSHRGEARQERDRFVDELYQSIGLPIHHIPVGSNFLECAQEISDALKSSGSIGKST